MAIAPPLLVSTATRQALPHGLFSVLNFPPTSADPHWQNGVIWQGLPCAPLSGVGSVDCLEPTEQIGIPKTFNQGAGPILGATEFTVIADYKCSPLGNSLDFANQRAAERLVAREEARVEQAIWTGDLGSTPNLADNGIAGLTAGDSPADSLGILEAHLAREYGSLGVIHMTRRLATVLVKEAGLVVSGSRLTTPLGTPVVAGAGYGAANGSDWDTAYATPALLGYRSEVFAGSNAAGDLLGRDTNDLYGIAERTYVVGWEDCGVASIDFDL